MSSPPTDFHKIWIEQCAAAEDIRESFGLESALDYLVGEKFFSFVMASEQHPRFTVLTPDGIVVSRGKAPDVGHGLWGDAKGDLYMTGSFPGAAGGFRGVIKFVRQPN